eukprot:scaffold255081_cov22-Prasinocladus_malaysianus.AAC.1
MPPSPWLQSKQVAGSGLPSLLRLLAAVAVVFTTITMHVDAFLVFVTFLALYDHSIMQQYYHQELLRNLRSLAKAYVPPFIYKT